MQEEQREQLIMINCRQMIMRQHFTYLTVKNLALYTARSAVRHASFRVRLRMVGRGVLGKEPGHKCGSDRLIMLDKGYSPSPQFRVAGHWGIQTSTRGRPEYPGYPNTRPVPSPPTSSCARIQ